MASRKVYRKVEDAAVMRAMFNAVDYETEIRAGRLHVRNIYSKSEHLSWRQNPCRSVRDQYVDGVGGVVAEVHYYHCRDGKTRPDPKLIVQGNVVYVLVDAEPA